MHLSALTLAALTLAATTSAAAVPDLTTISTTRTGTLVGNATAPTSASEKVVTTTLDDGGVLTMTGDFVLSTSYPVVTATTTVTVVEKVAKRIKHTITVVETVEVRPTVWITVDAPTASASESSTSA